MLRINRKRG